VDINFKRCTVIHKGNAFLYYIHDKNIPGYFITSVAISDSVKDKRHFMEVYEYFCTEIVRDKDIYCVLFPNTVTLFGKYMDTTLEYQGKTLHKVKKYEDIRIMQYYVAQQLKEQAHG
jgi:hypothetical protein